MNQRVFLELVSGVSQRRAAFLLSLNRKTIVRKFLFLGILADQILPVILRTYPKAKIVEFDDLETFEHSKLKPLSVILMVEHKSRRILGFRVARMPAKGLLTKLSKKRYGLRKDERKQKRRELFKEMRDLLEEEILIKSDENPHYQPDVKRFFPKAKHKTYKSRRACVVGQGELKAGGFDPIFSINHTFAMARANINRLIRRTWCTTKIPERLYCHLSLYALYHNLRLIR